MDRLPTWPVAAGSLLVGFGVAQATGIRPLGGIVLVAAAGWCTRSWWRAAGAGRAAGLLGVYFAAFVGSHLVAEPLGAWPAVLLAAGVTGLAAWALADARRPRPAAAA
jgi:thiol:disulfide interchange protein